VRSWRGAMVIISMMLGAAVALGLAGCRSPRPGAGQWPGARTAPNDSTTIVPSCSWPLRVVGKASPEQSGLVGCYLRARADRSRPGMLSVAYRVYPGGVHISPAAFARTADARSGVATIRLSPGIDDPYYFPVMITFADGAREQVFMALANPASEHSWRLVVATPNFQ